jgi:hypothetical protein
VIVPNGNWELPRLKAAVLKSLKLNQRDQLERPSRHKSGTAGIKAGLKDLHFLSHYKPCSALLKGAVCLI